MNPVSLPLAGVKVLELGTMITAPYAAMLLGELGASVIKVENPQGGDPFRATGGGQYGPNFVAYNHGKRSIMLDLKDQMGRGCSTSCLRNPTFLVGELSHWRDGQVRISAATQSGRSIRGLSTVRSPASARAVPTKNRPAYDAVATALGRPSRLAVESG